MVLINFMRITAVAVTMLSGLFAVVTVDAMLMLLCAYAAAVYLFFDWVKLGKRSDRG